MIPTQGSERWNEGLRLVSFCPVCETRYHPMEARMLGQDGETHLLHVQCRTCEHAILALVLVNHVGASSVGLLTDLSYEDVLSFREQSSVTVNDVLDVHEVFANDAWQLRLGRVHKKKLVRIKKKLKKLKD